MRGEEQRGGATGKGAEPPEKRRGRASRAIDGCTSPSWTCFSKRRARSSPARPRAGPRRVCFVRMRGGLNFRERETWQASSCTSACTYENDLPRSSRGLGRRPLTPVARVRIPYAVRHDAFSRRWPSSSLPPGQRLFFVGAGRAGPGRANARPNKKRRRPESGPSP